jgi:hypothetical protein
MTVNALVCSRVQPQCNGSIYQHMHIHIHIHVHANRHTTFRDDIHVRMLRSIRSTIMTPSFSSAPAKPASMRMRNLRCAVCVHVPICVSKLHAYVHDSQDSECACEASGEPHVRLRVCVFSLFVHEFLFHRFPVVSNRGVYP